MALMLQMLMAMAAITATDGPGDARWSGAMPGVTLAQAATPLQIPEAPPPVPPATVSPAPSPVPAPAAPATPPPAPDPAPVTPPAVTPPAAEVPPVPEQPVEPGVTDEDGEAPPEDLSLGEIPVIETIELTADIARRALDSYLDARVKYGESGLEQFEELQDFVDQTEDGKKFEADIKAAGFKDVNDWNLSITTLGVTYGSVIDDQTSELMLQIQEIEADTELAQDIKDRMITALKAMIPSDNNRRIVEELIADAVYGQKLKELDIEDE